LKTPPGWSSQIQTALAGQPSSNGGAARRPSDKDVKNSEVAKNNSGNGEQKNNPVQTRAQSEIDALLYAAAHYDELRKYITQPTIGSGFAGAQIGLTGFDFTGSLPGIVPYDTDTKGPIHSQVLFGPNGTPIGIAMALTTPDCANCELFSYDSTSGQVIVSHGDVSVPLNVTSASIREANATDRQQLGLTCACDFARWGFWSVEAGGSLGQQAIDLDIENATWITGNLTTEEQLNTNLEIETTDWQTTFATYSGDMVGTVQGTNAVASGSFDMDWNFGERSGTMDGSFDGRTFETEIGSGVGPGTSFHDTGNVGEVDAAIEGSFVNNGNQVLGGVIGGFVLQGDVSWSASGIFMGARGDNGSYDYSPP
jgi:hypothetical protein